MSFGGGKAGYSQSGDRIMGGLGLSDLQSVQLGQAIRSTPEHDQMRDAMMNNQNAMMEQMAMAQQQAMQGMPRTATEVMHRERMMREEHANKMQMMMERVNTHVVTPVVSKLAKKLIDAGRPIREILQDETDDWLKDAV